LCFGTSKLIAIETTAPLSNCRVPATWVGTSTGISVPFIGSLVTSRSSRGRAVEPITLATGPSSCTRSVM